MVTNHDIAGMLEVIADLLASDDANPFRVRAYRNGTWTLRRCDEEMADLVERRADRSGLPAIGEDLAALIEEAVCAGRMRTRDDLCASLSMPVNRHTILTPYRRPKRTPLERTVRWAGVASRDMV